MTRVILHWYVGPLRYLSEIVRRGYYLSIGPAVLYSEKVQELVKQAPPRLILTESDGPNRYRHGLIGHPTLVGKINTKLGEIWGSSEVAVNARIRDNFNRLIKHT